jgi:hypothetical protein
MSMRNMSDGEKIGNKSDVVQGEVHSNLMLASNKTAVSPVF